MTRISADPANVRSKGHELRDLATGCESVAARVRPTDVWGLPPGVAGTVMTNLSHAHGALQRGRNELHEVSREARRRAVQLEIAGGGGSAATRREMELIAADEGRYRDAFVPWRAAVSGFATVTGSVGFAVARSPFDLLGKANTVVSYGNTRLRGAWSNNRVASRLHKVTHSPLFRKVMAPLAVYDVGRSTIDAYRHSDARTFFGRLGEAGLALGGSAAVAVGPGAVADVVTGGGLSGTIDAATDVITGDTESLDDFSDSALDGQYGFGLQKAAQLGDWLGADVIGSLIYGD